MKLATKTFFIVTSILIALVCLQYFLSSSIFISGFHIIEEESAVKNINRVQEAINEQVNALATTTLDWSVWDEMYQYMIDKSADFERKNFGINALANIKINFFMLFDESKKVVFKRAIDIENIKFLNNSESVLKILESNISKLNFTKESDALSGLLKIDKQLILVSYHTIIKSDETGPVKGVLLFARVLDEKLTEKISKMTHLNFSIIREDDKKYIEIISMLKNENEIYLNIISSENLYGYGKLKNIFSEEIAVLEINIPRSVNLEARQIMLIYLIFMICGGIILIIVVNAIMHRYVIAPVIKLDKDVEDIAKRADLSKRINVQGKDEIATLSNEINKMLGSLEQSENEIQRLLDNTGEGFLMFDNKGIIISKISKAVITLFGINPAGKHIAELVGQNPETWRDYLDVIFDETLPFDQLSPLCPKEIEVRGKNIKLKYNEVRDSSNKLVNIMVISKDVTEVRLLQKQQEQERKTNIALINILKAKNDFLEILDMVAKLSEYKNNKEKLWRKIHTLKGYFGLIGCENFLELCHKMEDSLKEDSSIENINKIIAKIQAEVETFINNFDYILNIRSLQGKAIEVPTSVLRELYRQAVTENVSKEYLSQISVLLERPPKDVLNFIEKIFKKTAIKLHKEASGVEWLPSDKIDPEAYEELFRALIHIPRNAADHALETPEDREQKGKARAGKLTVSLKLQNEIYNLTICDDGCGVDSTKVVEKAKAFGLKEPQSEEELFETLFIDGFSTKEDVSETSGRGYGLSAVREAARKYGGDAKLSSKVDIGTTISIWFKKKDFNSIVGTQQYS